MAAGCLFLLSACQGDDRGSPPLGNEYVAVRIAVTGEGGWVRSADAAFECRAAACTEQVVRGTRLQLVAVPEDGASFLGWGGACGGLQACDLLADRDLDVTAAFQRNAPVLLAVAVRIDGEGDVRSTPAGIDCGQTCSATFPAGVTVSLVPTPRPGFLFTGWSGACSGAGACKAGPAIASNLSVEVRATFVRLAPERRGLTVAVEGDGTVRSSPPGIDCGATCSASFEAGTTVQLAALPAAGAQFAGWAGACAGAGDCTLTLNADAQVSATFQPLPPPPPPPPPPATLAVALGGAGAGRVTSDPPGIDCRTSLPGAGCSATFPHGSVVQLIPAADAGSFFTGWSGACSGAAGCSVTLAGDAGVGAVFDVVPPPRATLTVVTTGDGVGHVASVEPGIDCNTQPSPGPRCSADFPVGVTVHLVAAPVPGTVFAGWSGACTGTAGCTVTLDGNKTVSAAFTRQTATLTVTRTGSGTGRVASSPYGIDCGNTCTAAFAKGATVTLSQASDAGSSFAGWGGACSGTGGCTVTLDQDLAVSAAFDLGTVRLTVRRTGTGTGRVTSSPDGIACGDACSSAFAPGTVVTLAQSAATGSRFVGWSGACTGAGACALTLNAPAEVVAEFAGLPPAGISLYITHSDPMHNLQAVAPDGTAYATSNADSSAVVYASTDNARTWTRRGRASARVVRMTALSDGVLLADVEAGGICTIERSGDGGVTWTAVLSLGTSRTLSPHSWDERGSVVYLGEYQVLTQDAVPIRLWSSVDRGRTWSVLKVFTAYTHIHAVRVQPDNGAIWLFMGDKGMSAILRSLDGGATWQTMLAGEAQARVVDGVFTPGGLLYPLDTSPPLAAGVMLLAPDGTATKLAPLPGPSYSIHRMGGGGFLTGTTRAPFEVYPPPGEEHTYIFGSPDGSTWSQLARYPRINPNEYASADVYWELASGEAVIRLYNVEPMWSGEGYMLATVGH